MRVISLAQLIFISILTSCNCQSIQTDYEQLNECYGLANFDNSECKRCAKLFEKFYFIELPSDVLRAMKATERKVITKVDTEKVASHKINSCRGYLWNLQGVLVSQNYINSKSKIADLLDTIMVHKKNKLNYTIEFKLLKNQLKFQSQHYLDSLYKESIHIQSLNRILLTCIFEILPSENYETFLESVIELSRRDSIVYGMLLYDLEGMKESNPELFKKIVKKEYEHLATLSNAPNLNLNISRNLIKSYLDSK